MSSALWTPMPPFDTDNAVLAERMLSRPRACLAELAIAECRPTRIVRLGDRSFDLRARFPRAEIRDGSAPRGWPDFIWCDHHFAGNDPSSAIRDLGDRFAPGTVVGAVEVHDVGAPSIRTWLTEELGTVADARVRGELDRSFDPIQSSTLSVEGQWLALVWFGRIRARIGRRPTEAGPLCEEMDAF